MVARILRLRLVSLGADLRGGARRATGSVLGLLGVVVLAGIACRLLLLAKHADPSLAQDLVIIGGTLVSLCFLLVPLLVRHDGTLDPRSYATVGVETRDIAVGLGVASLVSVPAAALAVCAGFVVAVWAGDGGAAAMTVIAGIIAVLTWVLIARVAAVFASSLSDPRRVRDLGVLVLVLIGVMALPAVYGLLTLDWPTQGRGLLDSLAQWAGWTPFGAAWSVGGAAFAGHWGSAVLRLLVALASLAVVAGCWWLLTDRVTHHPARTHLGRAMAGLGWFGRLPARPVAAIAARSLTYWARDSRYPIQLVLVPIFPFVMVTALLVSGAVHHPRDLALLPLPVVCLFVGWVAHNDLAFDGTAVWLHIASGTRGFADRVGRLAPIIVVAVPVIAVGSILTALAYGSPSILPAVIGLSSGIVMIGLGLASVSSVVAPYAAPRPGDTAFAQPQRTGGVAAAAQLVTLFVTLMLSAPAAFLAVLGLVTDASWFVASMWVGLGTGVVVLVLGVWIGAAVFDRRGPELMSFALRNA